MAATCPYCREAIDPADDRSCPSCHTPHHADCWAENGGCTVFGCACAPPDEPKVAVNQDALPPFIPTAGVPASFTLPPASAEGNFLSAFLRDRRMLLRHMLFAACAGMPLGGLAGAGLGFGFGFLAALFGYGFGSIFTCSMWGICYGQALGVGAGIGCVALLGQSFVKPLRRQVRRLVQFIFEDLEPVPPAPETTTPQPPLP